MKKLVALAIAFAMPFTANAGEFNYSFIDFGYVRNDLASFDGFEIEGSWGFGENLFVDFDYIDGSNDVTEYEVGFGYHMPLASNVDGLARINYFDSEAGTPAIEGDGFGIDVGLRGMMGGSLEYNLGHSYRNGDIDGSSTSINENFIYAAVMNHFDNGFSFGVDAEFDVDDTYNIFGRYNF